MIEQALTDHVDVVDPEYGDNVYSDVPAYVFTLDSIEDDLNDPTRPNRLVEQLRMIVAPAQDIMRNYQIRWRGKLFEIDSDAMPRRKHGTDHHQTYNLKHIEG